MNLFKNGYIFLLAAIVLLLSSLPFLHETFFRIHDFTHVARIVELAHSWRAGHFPVQWSQNFGSGYGMPLFLFYGPLPFYLGALFTFLGISAVTAMKLTFLTANLLGFVGMYLLMKRWGRTVGFLSATAFLWVPYRALDIYVRGALSEVFALSLLPWILYWSFLLKEQSRKAWLGLSLTTAALLLTHNLTALIALPFLGVIAIVFLLLNSTKVSKKLFALGSAFALGLLLAAFYVLPLFLEKDFTIVNEITEGYFDFRLHFVYVRQLLSASWGYSGSTYGPQDGISFHLGRVALASAVISVLLAGVLFVRKIWLERHLGRELLRKNATLVLIAVTGIFLACSLFLTLTHSLFIWEAIPFLAYLQFPWRYLTLAVFLLSMLAGFSLLFIPRAMWRWAAMLALSIGIIVTQYQYHQPEAYLTDDQEYYYTDTARIRTDASTVLFDYLPATFNRELPPVSPEERILVNEATPSGTWSTNEPHELLLSTEASAGARIRWNIADFPGWKYTVNGEVITPTINEDGLATYSAPEDVTDIGAQFTPTPVRLIANIVSLLALLVWTTVALSAKKSRSKGTRA